MSQHTLHTLHKEIGGKLTLPPPFRVRQTTAVESVHKESVKEQSSQITLLFHTIKELCIEIIYYSNTEPV